MVIFMTRLEIEEELKKLTVEERLQLIESAIQLIRQELHQSQPTPSVEGVVRTFTFKALELPAYAPGFRFSRDELYDDDGR